MNAVLRRWPSFALGSNALEVLKWIAFAAMLVDHADVVFFDRTVPAMQAVGRIAMPLFCIVLGHNLARPGTDVSALLRRLVLVGALVQPLAIATINRGELFPLNVLWTFAAAVVLWRQVGEGAWLRALLVTTLAALFVDYSLAGVALVVGARAWYLRRDAWAAAAVAFAFVALCVVNGNAWALLAVPLVWAASAQDLPQLPRWRWWFWIAYPGHLLAFGLLARLG